MSMSSDSSLQELVPDILDFGIAGLQRLKQILSVKSGLSGGPEGVYQAI